MASISLPIQRLIKLQRFNDFSINIQQLIVFGVVSPMILLLVYFFQLSMFTAEKSLLQKSQDEISKLVEINKDLEVQLTRSVYLESENIDSITKRLGLERSDKIIYIQTIDNAVARNQ
jgi:predicted RND superfamily exporter protein